MASKNFSDVVKIERSGVKCNALVLGSKEVLGVEHLTLMFLDPAAASNALTGSSIERATIIVHDVKPLGRQAIGWTEVDGSVPEEIKAADLRLRGETIDSRGQTIQPSGPQLSEEERTHLLDDPQSDNKSATAPQRDPHTNPGSTPQTASLSDEDAKAKDAYNHSDFKHFDAKSEDDQDDDKDRTLLPATQETVLPGLSPEQKASIEAGEPLYVAKYDDGTIQFGAKGEFHDFNDDGAEKTEEYEHPESQAWHKDPRTPETKDTVEEHKNDEQVVEATAPQLPTNEPQPSSSDVSE